MNNTENKAAIKIEQSTYLDIKSVRDFNHQLTIPGQWEGMANVEITSNAGY